MSNNLLNFITLIAGLFIFNFVHGQDQRRFQFNIDSFRLDGINYPGLNIDQTIQAGKPIYFTILQEGGLAIRIRVKLTKRNEQPKTLKVRVDLFENGKWYKPPLTIDSHRFPKLRIGRDQCWRKTSKTYNAGFPINKQCTCWKPFKGAEVHSLYLKGRCIAT